MLYKVILSFNSVDEILKYDYSNKSHSAVLFCDIVYNMKLVYIEVEASEFLS